MVNMVTLDQKFSDSGPVSGKTFAFFTFFLSTVTDRETQVTESK